MCASPRVQVKQGEAHRSSASDENAVSGLLVFGTLPAPVRLSLFQLKPGEACRRPDLQENAARFLLLALGRHNACLALSAGNAEYATSVKYLPLHQFRVEVSGEVRTGCVATMFDSSLALKEKEAGEAAVTLASFIISNA